MEEQQRALLTRLQTANYQHACLTHEVSGYLSLESYGDGRLTLSEPKDQFIPKQPFK